MGICSSCLGRGHDSPDEDESTALLFDDPHSVHYGAFGDQNTDSLQADPQDVRRETEALQGIVAETSNHLMEIFSLVPSNIQRSPSTAYSDNDTRLMQYQDALERASTNINLTNHDINSSTPYGDWVSDEEEDDKAFDEPQIVHSKELGPMLGGFADFKSSIR